MLVYGPASGMCVAFSCSRPTLNTNIDVLMSYVLLFVQQ